MLAPVAKEEPWEIEVDAINLARKVGGSDRLATIRSTVGG